MQTVATLLSSWTALFGISPFSNFMHLFAAFSTPLNYAFLSSNKKI
jgi:hypothetical protein